MKEFLEDTVGLWLVITGLFIFLFYILPLILGGSFGAVDSDSIRDPLDFECRNQGP